MATVTYAHIAHSPEGVPYLSGTRTKVEEVALDHLAHRWDAEAIQRQYPDLSLGQIYSALAYYYDHREELDRSIDAGLREVAQIRSSLAESPIRLKCAAAGWCREPAVVHKPSHSACNYPSNPL
jgi:uncharacterized protein (DUF433 family)